MRAVRNRFSMPLEFSRFVRRFGGRARAGAAAVLAFQFGICAAAPAGLQKGVTFHEYSPLSSNAELIDRLFRPLLAQQLRAELASAGQRADSQSVDLAHEHFVLYVPENVPASGKFGLLVWISPVDEPTIPPSWLPVLDRHGVVCVAAAGSGNSANVFSRRIPLALLGYANVANAYPIDPARTYVGGLSGGSRVALRVALAFPDVFQGVLLNAGSDSFGSAALPPPKPELFRQFEEGTRLIYATGSHDEENLAIDAHSRESARKLCVNDIQTQEMRGRGHEMLDAVALEHALSALALPRESDAGLGACGQRRTQEIEVQLNRVQALIDAGDKSEAQKKLQDVDERFGGLATPRSMQLAGKL